MSEQEYCLCAAVRMDDGTIFLGKRHDQCILAADAEGYRTRQEQQGFWTTHDRFVDRYEGAKLHGIKGPLFSEDLY